MERRLSAIVSADVVGYSRLMEADETGTLTDLKALRKKLINPTIEKHKGRIVKLMGDGALIEFMSVVDAASCAIEMQTEINEWNIDLPGNKRIQPEVNKIGSADARKTRALI